MTLILKKGYVVVDNIIKDGVADKDGRLQVGDKLDTFNTKPVKGLTNIEINRMIKACPEKVSPFLLYKNLVS